MSEKEKVNILLVDDQPAKLIGYEVILGGLGENLIKTSSGKEALEQLLKMEIAVILVDVCMPDLDGFELATMIRQHPRYQKTAIILVSAVHMTDFDRLKGYGAGAVDYVSVPVIPEVLRAKVAVFIDLYRKTRELEQLNRGLEQRVAERTAELEASTQRLSKSEERFRLATEAMRGGIYDWDLESNVVQRSAGLVTILGYGPQEVDFNLDWWIARVHPEDVVVNWNAMRLALENGAPSYSREYRVRHRDGRWVWLWDRGRIVRDTTGQAVRVVGHITDIDVQKQAEEALRDADRRKDEFLAMVSHELRTPLTAMLGWARLLRAGQLDKSSVAHALETIERNAKSQAQLIEDLLDISRISTGKLRLNITSIELVTVIKAAIDSARPAAQAKDIKLVSHLDPAASRIQGDADRLQQVVWNLLSNAIKFTPAGGRVRIELERGGSHVQIRVCDTGGGISPDFLPYVFERFRQADATQKRQHGGLGLGLAIVRYIVEMHGGTVEAQSDGKGQGATFTVRLPLAEAHMKADTFDADERLVTQKRPFEVRTRLNGLHVLVVDDEIDTRELLAFILDQCGAKVTVVASPAEALTAMEQSRPDVLVSDIGMPGEDGYDLIRQVRARPPERGGHIPAVALTAYARFEDRLRVLSAGYQTHVTKPIEPEELITVIASLVERAGNP